MTLLDHISKSTGLNISYIERVVTKAPFSYKKYTIPKKNGGFREIFHPSKELKLIQRWLVTHIISSFPVHECVYSYKKGRGIKAHAEIHRSNNYILRIDLKNFFPSIMAKDVKILCLKNIKNISQNLTEQDVSIFCRIVCRFNKEDRGLALTIGSPASPAISNAILFEFDEKITALSLKHGLIYTRYADDLYFSTNEPNKLDCLYKLVEIYINEIPSPKLQINTEKTVYTSRKRRRVVTGIILTSENKLSIGREEKRRIRTQVYLYLNEKLELENLPTLRGKIAYYHSIEPSFIDSLKQKFGEENIDKLIKLQ